MQAALTDLRGEFRLSPNQMRVRAAVDRLEFDLLRYLRHEAGRDERVRARAPGAASSASTTPTTRRCGWPTAPRCGA